MTHTINCHSLTQSGGGMKIPAARESLAVFLHVTGSPPAAMGEQSGAYVA
jgi:hypothetical protein